MDIQATIVFQKIWSAIHEKCPECTAKGLPISKTCSWCTGSGLKYRYIKNSGSSRSSKTHSICQAVYLYALQRKQKRISVFRDTKIDCKETVGKDMELIYPGMPLAQTVTFNKTESVYRFNLTSSTIEIEGTDDPNRIHGYNGDVTWLCEPYAIPETVFDQLDMRTADFVILDLNPLQTHWSDKLDKDPRCLVIHSTFKENPFCPPEQRRKILGYQPVKCSQVVIDGILPEAEAKAYNLSENTLNLSEKLLADLSRCKENERKGTANAFNWSVYGLGEKAEKPNRIFFWEEISDDAYNAIDVTRYYGIDWGTVDPWGILEAKYYDGAFYFHEKNYKSENEIKDGLTMQELIEINKSKEALVTWWIDKLNLPKKAYFICDNNRPLKIQALWDAGYDYATSAPKPPGSIIDGITLLTDIKCYYTASSTNLKYENENYEREVDRYGIVLDTPVDTNNHLTDPARYIALYLVMMGIVKR